jgi:hypothetical protein
MGRSENAAWRDGCLERALARDRFWFVLYHGGFMKDAFFMECGGRARATGAATPLWLRIGVLITVDASVSSCLKSLRHLPSTYFGF